MPRRSRGVLGALVAVSIATAVTPLGPAAAQVGTFSPGSSTGGDPYFPAMGNGGYEVRHYDITFSYNPTTGHMVGTTSFSAAATQNLSRFNVDLLGLVVRAVTVNGAPATFSHQGQELAVTPSAGLATGQTFNVALRYDGNPSTVTDPDNSIEGWIDTDDGAYVVSAPLGAATWFPGNHDLRDKATHRFRATVPSGTTVVANGNLSSQSSVRGQTTFVWTSAEPMANAEATATVGRFNVTQSATSFGTNYVAVDPNTATSPSNPVYQTPDIVSWLSTLYGPYPFSASGGIVDNAGFVGYATETQTKPLYPFPPFTGLVVHEMAHSWFAASLTPTSWRDTWLNEGFATYTEWLWTERHGGQSAQSHFNSVYARSAGDPFWQVRPGDPGPQDIFHSTVYERGAMTLQALRAVVGNRTFFYILRAWAEQNRYGNVTTQQFIELAEQHSGRQLDDLFQRWLYTPGKPTFP